MNTTWKRTKKKDSYLHKQRRRSAIEQLNKDLATGFKRINGRRSDTPLTEKDITRIKKELQTLKQKI